MQKSHFTTLPAVTPNTIIEDLQLACDIDELKNVLVEMYCETNTKSYDPRYTNTFQILFFHLNKIQNLKQ